MHKMQLLYTLFLVGVLLHLLTNPAFSLEHNTISCIEKEKKALHDIQPECANQYQYNQTMHDCCNWPGISCSNHTGRIYRFDLDEFLVHCLADTAGEVLERPIHLGTEWLALEDLVYLNLNLNMYLYMGSATGTLSFIGSFPKLRHLFLCPNNETNMAIPPQVGNLTTLETLELCPYSPSYFTKLGILLRLTSLKRLVLSTVDLSGATDWVHVVNSLPSLEHLDLSSCRLPNVTPHLYSKLNSSKSLTSVDLSMNNLYSTTCWSWIFNHSSLIRLSLGGNQLSGSIPDRFRMPSLSHLDLSGNQLGGRLPSSFKGLCSLRLLDLSQNQKLDGDLAGIFRSLSCVKESLTVLSLHKNSFSGVVPNFSVFPRLSKVSLHSNRLHGSLPSHLEGLSRLVILNLRNNRLTGSVPDLSGCSSLEVLQLQNNKLNGTLHAGIGHLSRLRHLDISSNSLKGEICVSHFSNLSNLRYLDMSFNSLTFNVSSTWIPPFRLDTIGLASCRLGPRFPQWLRVQANYSKLDMSNAGILDTIPFWFWNLSSLATFIGLSHNGLHGILPNSSSRFELSPAFDLSSNLLEGTIPSFLGDGEYLNLSRNSFSGTVSFLCENSFKIGIDLSHNLLTGKLPDCWLQFLMILSVLDLSNNDFFGELPSSLGLITGLRSLHLRNNKFSGKLPSSLCNLTDLSYLDLGDNLISGDIPSSMGQMLPNLTILSLRNNLFTGSIPPQLCHLSSIQILDLSSNNFSGVIPNCLCSLKEMTRKDSHPTFIEDSNSSFSTIGTPYKDYISLVLKGYMYEYKNNLELVKSIDLSSNSLGGRIPDEVSCLTGLVSLNMSGNNLTGSISSKIGLMKSLESLDLSNNHFTGEIPPTLADLDFLGTLSLAHNNLSGKIPSGTQLQGFSAKAFEGNPRLCGDPLPKCSGVGGGKTSGTGKDNNSQKDNNRDSSLGLYISIALGFITGFWVVCGGLVLKKSWRYAYFRFWIRVYDRLYVMVTLTLARIRRKPK